MVSTRSGCAPPVGAVERVERGAILLVERRRGGVAALALEPFGEIGRRRQRHEGGDARNLPRDFLHHLLDEEVTEGHAGQAALAVGDRIEHRRIGPLRHDRLAPVGEDRRDRRGNLAGQRHLDEDQRLVDQRRVEEGITTAVGRVDAAAQIVPVADLVDAFVADDLFQDRSRRRPVDAAQHQEAAVEPRREQMNKVVVDDGEIVAMIERVD